MQLILKDNTPIDIKEYALNLEMFSVECDGAGCYEIFKKLTDKNLSEVKVIMETTEIIDDEEVVETTVFGTFKNKSVKQYTFDGSVGTFTLIDRSETSVRISALEDAIDVLTMASLDM